MLRRRPTGRSKEISAANGAKARRKGRAVAEFSPEAARLARRLAKIFSDEDLTPEEKVLARRAIMDGRDDDVGPAPTPDIVRELVATPGLLRDGYGLGLAYQTWGGEELAKRHHKQLGEPPIDSYRDTGKSKARANRDTLAAFLEDDATSKIGPRQALPYHNNYKSGMYVDVFGAPVDETETLILGIPGTNFGYSHPIRPLARMIRIGQVRDEGPTNELKPGITLVNWGGYTPPTKRNLLETLYTTKAQEGADHLRETAAAFDLEMPADKPMVWMAPSYGGLVAVQAIYDAITDARDAEEDPPAWLKRLTLVTFGVPGMPKEQLDVVTEYFKEHKLKWYDQKIVDDFVANAGWYKSHPSNPEYGDVVTSISGKGRNGHFGYGERTLTEPGEPRMPTHSLFNLRRIAGGVREVAPPGTVINIRYDEETGKAEAYRRNEDGSESLEERLIPPQADEIVPLVRLPKKVQELVGDIQLRGPDTKVPVEVAKKVGKAFLQNWTHAVPVIIGRNDPVTKEAINFVGGELERIVRREVPPRIRKARADLAARRRTSAGENSQTPPQPPAPSS